MNETSLENIASAWIKHAAVIQADEDDDTFAWSWDIESDYQYDDQPEKLWKLILEIHAQDKKQTFVELLSAGPLENLLVDFGDKYIVNIEKKAKADPAFAFLLGGVWKSSMNDKVWERVQNVWNRKGWDGN